MAKIPFSKLGLKVNSEVKIIAFNEQNIEVKQYLNVNDTFGLISDVITAAADDNNFMNPIKVDIFTAIYVIDYYTNINFTEKQREDPAKLYDLIVSSGLYDAVIDALPEDELEFLYDDIYTCADAIYAYRNSVRGIIDGIGTDYNNLDLDANNIYTKLADPENMTLLKNIVTKLG